jgi:hypothetical protein
MDKYKINYYLERLDRVSYKAAVRIIPKILQVCPHTFHKYRSLKVGDPADIPYGRVKKLEILFQAKDNMENYSHDTKGLSELIRTCR